MKREKLKIGVSGVRGVVGDSFTPQLAMSFAKAFGVFVGQGIVLIGRDTRPSGVMIEHAVVAGLLSVGCKPLLMGVVPTPSLLIQVKTLGARGGIMITASHNDAEWNALKFVDRRGLFLGERHTEEFFDVYHQQDFPLVAESDLRVTATLPHAADVHFDLVGNYIDAPIVRRARFRVAVDCCNGVGALYSRSFLAGALGCEVIALHDRPDGNFQRGPEPLPENLGALSRCVIENKCDIGFAQDPDGDRLAVVDEKGHPIGEERTVALAIQAVLRHHAVGPVAVNLSFGKGIESVAREFNIEVVRTKTGEINVSETMIEIGAVAGGEHTGGIIIPAIHPCRDSYGGMAVLLEAMALTQQRISELDDTIPRYSLIKDKLPIQAEQAPAILRMIRNHFAAHPQNLLDGVHVDFGDAWVHVRRSNTEPVLRVIAEAATPEISQRLVDDLKALITD